LNSKNKAEKDVIKLTNIHDGLNNYTDIGGLW